MRNREEKIVVVKSGRFKGQNFRVENELSKMPGGEKELPMLAMKGNWAARNALNIDKYTVDDGPFYYGKIGSLGYIISVKDLGL